MFHESGGRVGTVYQGTWVRQADAEAILVAPMPETPTIASIVAGIDLTRSIPGLLSSTSSIVLNVFLILAYIGFLFVERGQASERGRDAHLHLGERLAVREPEAAGVLLHRLPLGELAQLGQLAAGPLTEVGFEQALVGAHAQAERLGDAFAVVGEPEQLPAFLGSLPPQRSLTSSRLDGIVDQIRGAVTRP